MKNALGTVIAVIALVGVSCARGEPPPMKDSIHVRAFGAIPDDGQNDAPDILAAIRNAQKNGIRRVCFDAGTYDFSGMSGWEREAQSAPGACYMPVNGASDLELVGAVDAQGRPTTRWIKHNDLQEEQPSLLVMAGGTQISVRNLVIDMDPYYYSAGKVLRVDGADVEIEVLAGHPRIDGQRAYIMGTYDFCTRLAKVARLTWDIDLPRWHTIGADDARRMVTTHQALAETCRPGDGVYWFQGNYCGPLLSFQKIDGLLLENIHILGGHGFTLNCGNCRDVTYRNVKLAPDGNRIATSCRDGFKIYRAGGKVVMDGVVIDGCLGDDGQNIHGTWLVVAGQRSSTTLVATHPSGRAGEQPLTPGRRVKLLDRSFVSGWESEIVASAAVDRSNLLITVRDALPAWVENGLPIEPQEWLPDELIIRNCIYRNTGRFGVYLKASHAVIEDTLFEGNAGALRIGGEWSWKQAWLEATHPCNVEVRRCTFRHNRLDMRYGGRKEDTAITIAPSCKSEASGLLRDIRIHDNLFEDEGTCLKARNCEDVWFWNNRVSGCGTEMTVDEKTTRHVYVSAPGG